MSNPWKDSAADVAITPLNYLLASIHDSDHHSEIKITNDSNSENSLVQSLRLADSITQKRRDLKYRNKIENMYSETTLTNNLVEELDMIFRDLTNSFDTFQDGNLLKNAYENSVYVSITAKDNLGENNRVKIVNLIRTCVTVIKTLKETKLGDSLQIREDVFSRVLESSGIMDNLKLLEDYSLDDLFEVITECNLQIRALKDFNAFPSEGNVV
jgi:hypothetical protein